MRSNDPRMALALPKPQAGRPTKDFIVAEGLETRVVGTAEWQARAKELHAAGGEPTPPEEHEQEVVVTVRGAYVMPSDLLPEGQWPIVRLDLFELGRASLTDIRAKVHAKLSADGHPFASRVVPYLRPNSTCSECGEMGGGVDASGKCARCRG